MARRFTQLNYKKRSKNDVICPWGLLKKKLLGKADR